MFVKLIDERTIEFLPENGEIEVAHIDENGDIVYSKEGVINLPLYCEENPSVANYNGFYELVDTVAPEGDYETYYELSDSRIAVSYRQLQEGL